jgi:hypothetical protein
MKQNSNMEAGNNNTLTKQLKAREKQRDIAKPTIERLAHFVTKN